jgi:hypothetical protein
MATAVSLPSHELDFLMLRKKNHYEYKCRFSWEDSESCKKKPESPLHRWKSQSYKNNYRVQHPALNN